MIIRLDLQNVFFRQGFFLITLVAAALLFKVISGEFVVGALSDKRIGVNKDLLTSAAVYYSDSGRLLARLAEFEMTASKVDFESAEDHIRQAIILSPNNYRYRLLLAEIRESRGDANGTEQAFNDALRLAPNYSEVHWRLANFLVREKRIEDSIGHFRIAVISNPALIASTLDLVAAVSDKNIFFLKEIVKDNQRGQLKLALLLANQSRIAEAAEVFSNIDKNITLSAWETSAFFDSLINKGFPKLAFDLWTQLKSGETVNRSLIWNGDFETESDSKLAQFDWRIGKSDYARIGFDSSETHSGKRSLLLDFPGRDTTKLDNEVRHLVALKPGTNYRFEFYVKTEEFKTDEGPRVVISDKNGNRIAQSEPVPAGTNDWKRMSFGFTAPQKPTGDAAALFISVKRQPRYSYDAPTRGRIWFDDFVINEVNGK